MKKQQPIHGLMMTQSVDYILYTCPGVNGLTQDSTFSEKYPSVLYHFGMTILIIQVSIDIDDIYIYIYIKCMPLR